MKFYILSFSTFFLLTSTALAQQRGLVSSAPCPYSCRTMGIEKRVCRDWREGNTCYIEDLTKPPQAAPPRPQYPSEGYPNTGESDDREDCRRLSRLRVARPRVYISRVDPTGNFFGSKSNVYGSVEGICLVEAGTFEDGRRAEQIPVTTTPDFRRFEFKVRVDGSRSPEIRAYNIFGDSDAAYVEGGNPQDDRYRDRYDNRYPNDRGYPYQPPRAPAPREGSSLLDEILKSR